VFCSDFDRVFLWGGRVCKVTVHVVMLRRGEQNDSIIVILV
jgi:hypothetical protein